VLTPQDEATLEAVVRTSLFALRFAGLMIAIPALSLAAMLFGDAISRASNGSSWNQGALVAGALCLVFAALGIWLFIRGKRPRGAALFRLLTTDAARIRTLRFLGLTNHPFSHVYLGVEGGKEQVFSFPGPAEHARAFFTRVYPHARVGSFPDLRKAAPSKYAQ
jgi:hypothetical protein